MPTTGYNDEEVEKVFEHLEELMENLKENDNCNSIVGEGQEEDAVGKYGLGVRNNREQSRSDFCKETELLITNTNFQQHSRHRYT
jgi:hypothetical protein